MEIRALLESERDACVELWRTVWPGDNDAYFRRYFDGDVEWLPYYTQVAVDAGRIVSAAHICKRTVSCGEFRLQMGGIANVATHPDFRGRGLNSACLRAAIGVMEADAMDFSLLFTGINGYYARHGFSTLPRTRMRGLIRAERAEPEPNLFVRPATYDDLESVFAIYDVYNAERPIAVRRLPAYWRDWIGVTQESLRGPDPPLVAEAGDGKVVGYIAYQTNFYGGHQITEDYAYVSEYGAMPAPGAVGRRKPPPLDSGEARQAASLDDVAFALLSGVATRALASGKRELHFSVALDDSVRAAAARVCVTIEENVTESAMGRLLHREALVKSLAMEWNDRWIEAGRPSGAVAFDTPYGSVRIDASGPFLYVSSTPDAGGAISQADLIGLIIGSVAAQQLEAGAEERRLLSALFPPRAGVYWGADGF